MEESELDIKFDRVLDFDVSISATNWGQHKKEVDISQWLKSTSQQIRQDPSPRIARPKRKDSLPGKLTDDFEKLIVEFQGNPRLFIRSTLNQLITELLELENIYEVALLNHAVTNAGRLARESWKRAEQFWRLNLVEKGHTEAQEAVYQQIKSLIAAYQTTAAWKIVEARKFMEVSEWKVYPEIPLAIHKKAREFYKKGRDAQDLDQQDLVRAHFSESIIEIEKLYLESERLLRADESDEVQWFEDRELKALGSQTLGFIKSACDSSERITEMLQRSQMKAESISKVYRDFIKG